MPNYRDRITLEPGKRGGKPCIRGLRITALDTVQKTFELRGVKVKYNDSTRFEDGGLAQLALNAKVEVSATLEADGRTLLATEVEFDD